jgi:hypothetical protein
MRPLAVKTAKTLTEERLDRISKRTAFVASHRRRTAPVVQEARAIDHSFNLDATPEGGLGSRRPVTFLTLPF